MQTPDLGRRFRSRFVAAAVIGALALSMLPAASASADSYVAVAVRITGLQYSAGVNETFGFQVEAVDAYGFRDAVAAGVVGGYAMLVWTGRADGGAACRPGGRP